MMILDSGLLFWATLYLLLYILCYIVSQKRVPVYFWNNSVKRLPILLFLHATLRKKRGVNDFSFAHLTLTMLQHYLVKCRSRYFGRIQQ